MTSIMRSITLTILTVGSLIALAQPLKTLEAAQEKKPKQAPSAKQPVHSSSEDAGDRAFQANCSRCHNAPEQLNPRISGTVLRHMRVRANLSADDERAIIRFLNP